MARKLRKNVTPLSVLFVELLVPWLVMGLLAIAGASAGLPDYAIFAVALAGALIMTYVVFRYERKRKTAAAIIARTVSEPEAMHSKEERR